jgi:hypothetical protein
MRTSRRIDGSTALFCEQPAGVFLMAGAKVQVTATVGVHLF